jgi:hypothetical protein
VLTLQNAARVVREAAAAAWLPVQAAVGHQAATRTLWRPGRALITAAQLEALVPRLAPGDVLVVRRQRDRPCRRGGSVAGPPGAPPPTGSSPPPHR